MSFSSTVFAVKALEGKAEMSAILGHGAIGILVMQDILAVFLERTGELVELRTRELGSDHGEWLKS